ncbi:WD repeat and HMG-box DNA-binding protein 1 isoform X3 [Bacillus rossius redtenbacheri]|uniref:WD repeat and HMG-box DNA-binding protein 1 isoform X3 n=1 Tax=Bacillus rossius redtenbacheri TaxID=93214 RepID=UPI002FDD4DD3
MPMKNNPVRYAHTDGHTDVCYSEDGKYILTCGNDGDIRVWLGLEDDDPTSHCVGQNALALVQKGSSLYVATDDNSLRCYRFPQMERDGVLTRFSKPVSHISVSPDGSIVVAASENSEIFVRNMKNEKIKMLSGHSGPILSVAVDPKLEYLASSSGDGKVCVWDLATASVLQSWTCAAVCASFFEARALCRVSWQSGGGQVLAVPEGNHVVLYKRATWRRHHVFSHPAVQEEVSISCFSPCGRLLAASSLAGDIVVWSVQLKSCVGFTSQHKQLQICGLAWNPTGSGELAFCDFSGQLGTVCGCLEEEHPEHESIEPGEPSTDGATLSYGVDSDDDENSISLEKIKAEVAVPLCDDILESASVAGASEGAEDAQGEGLVLSEMQPPFQPSATPHHLQHNFMVWNCVGVVRCSSFPEDVIDVEFHDTSTHHALHLSNSEQHSLAALTEHALVLACEGAEDRPSQVTCVLLRCWDGTREWSAQLPAGEDVLCVASGSDWVAAATDSRLLRLWTLSGVQREVLALPGPVLCLASHARMLLVACHLGPGVGGEQSIGYCEVDTQHGSMSKWQPLPLTPRSTLQWLGYSDEGSPCLHDSSGSVRILSPRGYWLPVLHTSALVKGKSDHYFVLGASEAAQNVRAVLCKGARYPPTTPRPPVLELPLKLALADVATERGQLEDVLWRSTLGAVAVPTAERGPLLQSAKEASLKLFAMACRAEQQARALELCRLTADPQVVQLAIKYASKLGKTQLVDRIAGLDASLRLAPRWQEVDGRSAVNIAHCDAPAAAADVVEDAHVQAEGQSLIMEAGRAAPELPAPAPAPAPGSGQTRVNPFKKSGGQLRPGQALSNLTNAAAHSIAPAVFHPTSLPVFVDWFAQQQAALLEEFPHVTPQELTREGLKRYKDLQTKVGTPASKMTLPQVGVPASKRMLPQADMSVAKKPAPASSKLTAFLFKKS